MKDKRWIANEALLRARKRQTGTMKVTPDKIAKFSQMMRSNLISGNNKFRRTYLNAIVEKIVVKRDAIYITGKNEKLSGAIADDSDSFLIAQAYAVLGRMNEWCTQRDSNS
jgi:site-specific DNA recombinase